MRNDTVHTTNRQVTDAERAFWTALKSHAEQTGATSLRTKQPAGSAGLNKQRQMQIVATWANEGLVDTSDNLVVMLTEYGRQVSDIESSLVSGESWR